MDKKLHRELNRYVRHINEDLRSDCWDKIRGRFYVREKEFHPRYNAIVYEFIDLHTGHKEEYVAKDLYSWLSYDFGKLWWKLNDFVINVRMKENW